MSNFPLPYKLSWLPRFLMASLAGNARGFSAAGAVLMPPPERSVRLAFVGDISAVANRGLPVFDPAISDLLRSADLVIGNCESPVVERPYAPVGSWLGTRHAMTEDFLAGTLASAGIGREKLVLSLANNHALDQGMAGFTDTVAALKRLGIRSIGRAGQPVERFRVGPLSVGFVAFTLWRNGSEADFTGRVSMAPAASAPEPDHVDLLCVLPHWDWEFRHFPCAETRTLAKRIAMHGAGLVVGGHAHVVQPVARFGEAVCAFGLGDFLGTAFARQPWPGRIGAILTVQVSTDAETRGALAAYDMHFFFRLREGRCERLVPVEALAGAMREKVTNRLAAIFGEKP